MKMLILIVDDEPHIRKALQGLLEDEGYSVHTADTGEACIERVTSRIYDVIFLDLKLPGIDGIETLKQIRELSSRPFIVMMSGHSDLETAVQATKLGAHNFLEKPLSPERVLIEVAHIAHRLSLEARVEVLESMMDEDSEIIGDSLPMHRLKETIAKSAPTDGRILIFGENGTGKELVARAIHRQSLRKTNAFVTLNCAAIPENLVESELFGYEKGAFTGAEKRKPGRFEIADGGTLFLDEVGDMNLSTQAKLLRVLQENEAVRLGGHESYKFNVRLIAATNKNLNQAIREGKFREDLYYRLNVVPIHVPPLRERPSDIPVLAHHFLRQIGQQTGRGVKQWGEGCMTLLCAYHWPGNVRELMNFTERMIILSRSSVISCDEAEEALPNKSLILHDSVPAAEHHLSFRERIEAFEKQVLMQGFHEVNGNISELARRMKIDRANLHRKLKMYGIK